MKLVRTIKKQIPRLPINHPYNVFEKTFSSEAQINANKIKRKSICS